MKIIITLLLLLLSFCSIAQEKKQILLIGTFHFNNPGADMAKTESFDILSEEAQTELDELAQAITDFKPDHIFTEWDYDEQPQLDSLYDLYLAGDYFKDTSGMSDYYLKGEIFQLAFRVGRLAGTQRISGIDYHTGFPADSMLAVMDETGQQALKQGVMELIAEFSEDFNQKLASGMSLKDLMLYMNSPEMQAKDQRFYVSLSNPAGDMNNHVGAHLVSQWYRRNIFMLSFLQKQLVEEDKKIMLLLGASHTGAIRRLLAGSTEYEIVELKDVLD